MAILEKIKLYMALSFVTIILILIALCVIFVLVYRRKKTNTEVNYDYFERRDSMEYLKFDEIISSNPDEPLKGAGVMVVNHTTFVAALNVTGYNFFDAAYEAQVNTINATISFMDALERPITLRQTTKAIDISHNIEAFTAEAGKLKNEIAALTGKIDDLLDDAEDQIDFDVELANEYVRQAQELSVKKARKTSQLGEAEEMIRYMNEISVQNGQPQKVQTIVFSYVYDGTQFTSALTKEEIYEKAMTELNSMADSLSSSLYRCGCTARRLSGEDLVDLMRRHMHPATCDDYTIRELFNSDLDALFVTSESLLDYVKEQMTDEAYEKKLKEVKAELEEAERRNTLLAERAESDRLDKTREIAARSIQIDDLEE